MPPGFSRSSCARVIKGRCDGAACSGVVFSGMSKLHDLILLVAAWGCLILVAGCGGSSISARSGLKLQPGAVSLFAIQPGLEQDGNPVPNVGAYPDGTASLIRYSMCAAQSPTSCASVPLVKGVPLPGPQPAGTLFKVTAHYRGRAYSSKAKWHGRVRAVSRPALAGAARVGSTVSALPARWIGGWATDMNQLAIEACRTRGATGCVMLTGVWLECNKLGCGIQGGVIGDHSSGRTTKIGYALSGWYLFALDARMDPTLNGAVGVSSPAALPVWRVSPTLVRSAPYGPISGPPAPRVHILPRAEVHGNQVVVASVRCAVSCHVWITASRVGKHFSSGERVAWSANKVINRTARLGVWGSLPRGRVAVQIHVGDGPVVHAPSRVP